MKTKENICVMMIMKRLLFMSSWQRFPIFRRKMREFAEERLKTLVLIDARKTLFCFA